MRHYPNQYTNARLNRTLRRHMRRNIPDFDYAYGLPTWFLSGGNVVIGIIAESGFCLNETRMVHPPVKGRKARQ